MRGLALALWLAAAAAAQNPSSPRLPGEVVGETPRESLAEGEVGFRDRSTGTVFFYEFEVVRNRDSLVTVAIGVASVEPGPTVSAEEATYLPKAGGERLVLPLSALQRLVANLESYSSVPSASFPKTTAVGITESGEVVMGIQRTVGWPTAVLGLLLALALGSAALLYARSKKDRRARHVLLEAQRAAVASREAERLRIARELHDGPVQQLHGLRLRMRQEPAVRAGERDPGVEIQEVVDEVRAISEDLRPPALGPFGLAAALEAMGHRASRQHPHVTVIADVESDDSRGLARPEEEVQLALFRIAQEAMNNALEHANPSVIVLRYRPLPARQLEVTNDGRDFAWPADLGTLREGGHFGLVGIAERVELIGGRLEVLAREGGGTRMRVTLK